MLRRVIGVEAEERVAAYSALGWSLDVLTRQEIAFGELEALGRDVLLIRPAN